jgi:hypothetical protein
MVSTREEPIVGKLPSRRPRESRATLASAGGFERDR